MSTISPAVGGNPTYTASMVDAYTSNGEEDDDVMVTIRCKYSNGGLGLCHLETQSFSLGV